MKMRYLIVAIAMFIGTFATPARAFEGDRWHVMIYSSIWTENRLRAIPLDFVVGKLHLRDSYMASLAVSRTMIKDFDIPLPFTDFAFKGNDLEIEAQVVKHFGFQNHVELTASLLFRTGDLHLGDEFYVNFAVGEGISYALAPPVYEMGATLVKGVKPFKFQNYLSFEFEFTAVERPDWHLVARLHHRSGVYGLISPLGTGSNFLGIGIKKDL